MLSGLCVREREKEVFHRRRPSLSPSFHSLSTLTLSHIHCRMQSNQPPPVTAQQQSVILQLQQAAQQSQSTTNGGVTTSQKHLGDGDDQYRNAK